MIWPSCSMRFVARIDGSEPSVAAAVAATPGGVEAVQVEDPGDPT